MASDKNLQKKSTTVREKVASKNKDVPKKRRIRSTVAKVKRPVDAVRNAGKKEYYIPLPDNKTGTFLNKKRRIIPNYFREAWAELKLVSWPNRRETTKLTVAVLLFAIVFGVAIAIVDYGLDKLFKELLLK